MRVGTKDGLLPSSTSLLVQIFLLLFYLCRWSFGVLLWEIATLCKLLSADTSLSHETVQSATTERLYHFVSLHTHRFGMPLQHLATIQTLKPKCFISLGLRASMLIFARICLNLSSSCACGCFMPKQSNHKSLRLTIQWTNRQQMDRHINKQINRQINRQVARDYCCRQYTDRNN